MWYCMCRFKYEPLRESPIVNVSSGSVMLTLLKRSYMYDNTQINFVKCLYSNHFLYSKNYYRDVRWKVFGIFEVAQIFLFKQIFFSYVSHHHRAKISIDEEFVKLSGLFGLLRPTRESITYLKTLPIPVNGCKF